MIVILPELLVLFEHSEVGVVALGGDLAVVHGLFYGAAWLVGVGAGGETAVARVPEHFREVEGDLLLFKVDKAETPKTRRINDEAT